MLKFHWAWMICLLVCKTMPCRIAYMLISFIKTSNVYMNLCFEDEHQKSVRIWWSTNYFLYFYFWYNHWSLRQYYAIYFRLLNKVLCSISLIQLGWSHLIIWISYSIYSNPLIIEVHFEILLRSYWIQK